MMPAERVAMRHVREIIRLKFSAGISTREIARRLGIAASTVRETLRRFEGAGLGWPLPDGMSDGDLEAALYANHGTKRGHRRHAEPDWPTVHRELKRKHVTLVIVWDEYVAANPGGYSYSRFCELYRGFESKLSPTMRQTHAAGERLFVDYAGDGVPVVIDRNPQGANLRRRARRVELHFCARELDASAARLDRRPCPRPRGDRWRSAFTRAGQYQDRCYQGLSLRSSGQSNLRRDGGALRHRYFASEAETSEG
jgi:transposase